LITHLVHSSDPETGGVAEACSRLDEKLNHKSIRSRITEHRNCSIHNSTCVVAHGLWQWPGYRAWINYRKYKIPYFVFPHGMLDPWFKKSYPLKHIKKQAYWWWRQGNILRDAEAVCFTTEEERLLAHNTFFPYRCNEVVTGLGVGDPPGECNKQADALYSHLPQLKNKRVLLFLGRFHPKKGVDLLINSFLKNCGKGDILLLGGPTNNSDSHLKNLRKLTVGNENKILWAGMLEGDLKWGALRNADALILPSHQENFGMVIAEALSVGTPVFLTNKVNLWREVIDSGAGLVANDDQFGIDRLVGQWVNNEHLACVENTLKCFREKLHISQTVEKLISIFPNGN
jgi:glycosyltransferase involved in cell wall biosynthesis